ncbi:MAG: hypothetical protein ACF8MF_01910 [Phycisphaerales bacterium JB052]
MKAHIMIPIRPLLGSRCTAFLVLSAGTLLLSAGCNNPKVSGPRTESPESLTMDDFIAIDASASTRPQQPDSISTAPTSVQHDAPEQTHPPSEGITLASPGPSASPSVPSVRPVEIANPSTPVAGSADQTSTQRRLQLLDAKVGDVNGKPIFTSSFFAPIEARLLAEAQQLPLNDWRGSAGRIIAQRLDGIIADELLRAEALASLTPTQRVGLQAFLSGFRNNLLSENLGSSQLAERRIQEREGITLDEALRQKEVDTLVQLTLYREINRRVNVSWRDIKQRYERDIDQFSPPPTAVLLVIRAFKDETEKVEQIKDALASGQDFADIAAGPLNNYNTDQSGQQRILIDGSFEETQFFGPEALNEATRGLQLGDSVGPIELGSSVYWIKLSDMEQETISLYDAQLKIQRELTAQRREEAKQQYFDRLQERARVSTRDQVLVRLFEIADKRYAPKR